MIAESSWITAHLIRSGRAGGQQDLPVLGVVKGSGENKGSQMLKPAPRQRETTHEVTRESTQHMLKMCSRITKLKSIRELAAYRCS